MGIMDDFEDTLPSEKEPWRAEAREPRHGRTIDSQDDEPGTGFDKAKAIRETDKALLVKLGRRERWVPKGQIHSNSEVWKNGDEGKLVISTWLSAKWEDEKDEPVKQEEPPVIVEDVACLRESAKAIMVRQGVDGEEIWIPKGQVLPESEVKGDGDCGKLVITAWISKEKNLR